MKNVIYRRNHRKFQVNEPSALVLDLFLGYTGEVVFHTMLPDVFKGMLLLRGAKLYIFPKICK
ncbi:MAG: hypothetical protein MJZ12_07560, partial [Prevotella sp.]|nr:hypothetical protein [Prevotella sp.]